MEEIKEKSAKKPVSMRLTATASERLMHIIDLYKNLEDPKGEQQENAILRILDIAESDNIRGTHPELEGPLLAVEATISTLIKQLNGIAVGQDAKISRLQEALNAAITEKEQAIAKAQIDMDRAQQNTDLANRLQKEAMDTMNKAEEDAAAQIEAIKKETTAQIEKVMSEKEHACRERDDARTIANEKTASNDLLKKMTGMEADLEKYKDLQEQYKELQDKFSALQSQLNESKLRAEIDKERAVMDKEREMQERIREADRENAKLQAKIEQLSPAEASPK